MQQYKFDESEVSRCLLCADPKCTKACPQHADVGNILRNLFFEDYYNAADRISNIDCTYCNAPCEKACVLSAKNNPVKIREIFVDVKATSSRKKDPGHRPLHGHLRSQA